MQTKCFDKLAYICLIYVIFFKFTMWFPPLLGIWLLKLLDISKSYGTKYDLMINCIAEKVQINEKEY